MRKCLEDATTLANNELTKAETKLMASLERWDEDQYWKDRAMAGFKDASPAFRSYAIRYRPHRLYLYLVAAFLAVFVLGSLLIFVDAFVVNQ